MSVCKTLKHCEKCACEKKQGLADAIAAPKIDPAALVREVPQMRDDCACGGGIGGVDKPNHGGGNVNGAANANEWVRVVDLADEELGYMDKDGQ